jgi:riboflavin synthase alpha subunit
VAGDGRSVRMRFRCPPGLSRYVARKGSIAIDGVSLTVNDVDGDEFGVNLIPHTQSVTTLGEFAPGFLHLRGESLDAALNRSQIKSHPGIHVASIR